jgi:hypothetical protein
MEQSERTDLGQFMFTEVLDLHSTRYNFLEQIDCWSGINPWALPLTLELWSGVAEWLGCRTLNETVVRSIPGEGTAWYLWAGYLKIHSSG